MYSGYHDPQLAVQPDQNSAYYHQGLGTAGHRVSASVNYLPSYSQIYQAPPLAHMSHMLQMPQVFPPLSPQQNPEHFAPQLGQQCQQQDPQAQGPSGPVHVPHQSSDESNGGISSILEYNINNMSTFLSWCTFGMLKQNRNPGNQFDEWVILVLYATRLPKLTIIIALEYMNQRYLKLELLPSMKDTDIFTVLIVSLVLANKFNDDNTFTNRLWSGATGIDIAILNREERTWLAEVGWQLNVVQFESNIRTLEACWSTWLEKYTQKCSLPSVSSPLSPNYRDTPLLLSPVHSYSNYYYLPVVTLLPTVLGPKYAHDSSIWGYQHTQPSVYAPTPTYPSKIWSYGHTMGNVPSYPYVKGMGYNYYNYLMASC